MTDKLTRGPVNGHQVTGPGEVEHKLQFFGLAVAGGVDFGRPSVHHLGALAVEQINQAGDGFFVPGYEAGREDDRVTFTDGDLAMLPVSHAVEGAHGFALAAGGHYDHLLVWQIGGRPGLVLVVYL